ncbi:BTAD domain-containing putative transcriptional regulator [Plantactinospora sp. DSM 117369]
MRPAVRTADPDPDGGTAERLSQAEVTFRVLGPLALAKGTEAVVLPPSRVTNLLAALLLRPNEVVSVGALQEAIWGDDQPAAAKGALQTCAMRLRQLFVRHGITATAIETVPGGYRVRASAETVDLVRFRELAKAAESRPHDDQQLVLLEAALALWNGPVLANVPSETLHRDVVPRLNEERLRVLERLCDLKIQLGFTATALVQLWEATRAYPGNERFAEQLIEALYRTGRQTEAVAEYRRIKDYLSGELGVDPRPRLRRLESNILTGQMLDGRAQIATSAQSAEPHDAAASRPSVRAPREFVGRAAAARVVAERLVTATGIVVLTGPPGVGKSALARYVAAQRREDFPAGQLMVRMRAPGGEPLTTDELAARVAGWTRTGARRRGLLVLDDVADVQQALTVAPMWTPGDAVLLTSQFSLAGVVARFGGWIERLEGLSPAESVTLLSTLIGEERVEAEPAAAAELAELCGHLPLALRIAAGRLLTRTRTSLAESVAWLREDPINRLALPGDPDMSLLGRFDTAVNRLPPALVDAFLRLGTHEQDTLALPAVADRLRVTPDVAEAIVDQLTDASLFDERPGHYRMRELLRLYSHAATDGRRPGAGAVVTLTASGTEFR